jgi:small subunit ribosomal protein S2
MARSAAQANAGRTEDGAEAPVGGGEPLADWERELLTGGADAAAPAADAAAPAADAAAPAADAAAPATATELPETPAAPPAVTANEVAPVEGVPATGDTATGTQGAQNG